MLNSVSTLNNENSLSGIPYCFKAYTMLMNAIGNAWHGNTNVSHDYVNTGVEGRNSLGCTYC